MLPHWGNLGIRTDFNNFVLFTRIFRFLIASLIVFTAAKRICNIVGVDVTKGSKRNPQFDYYAYTPSNKQVETKEFI